MILMTGRELAGKIREQLRHRIETEKLTPGLAVILVGEDAASEKYVSIKERACQSIGISFFAHKYNANASQGEILSLIDTLNNDSNITGIIVQLPLPKGLSEEIILNRIMPSKDVDGLTKENQQKLEEGLEGLRPATPEGVLNLLYYYQIPLKDQKIAVIGRSILVGKPIAIMLGQAGAIVSVGHSQTSDIGEITKTADIVISAVGKPNLIIAQMVKEGAVIIDVGTTPVNGEIVGDVEFNTVSQKASLVTPTIGGVGPMTVAMLLSNVLKAYDLQKGE